MTYKPSKSNELPISGYLRQAQLIPYIVPFSAATLWRKVKNGTFPAPVKLSTKITAWKVDDVKGWMKDIPQSNEVKR